MSFTVYENDTSYATQIPYGKYREKWLSTSQPDHYISHLTKTVKDKRTMAEILEDDGTVAGYLWVTFTDVNDYGITIAEVNEIAVTTDYQRRGIGTSMMKHIEEMARERGATFLRSGTGFGNVASRGLHEKAGFRPCGIQYEKILS